MLQTTYMFILHKMHSFIFTAHVDATDSMLLRITEFYETHHTFWTDYLATTRVRLIELNKMTVLSALVLIS